MKQMLVIAATVFLIAGGIAPVAAGQGPDSVDLENKMGTVVFPHAAHQELVEDCTTCHHSGLDQPKCGDCHGVDPAAPDAKDAYHTLCKDCHKEQGGPTGCKDCHQK